MDLYPTDCGLQTLPGDTYLTSNKIDHVFTPFTNETYMAMKTCCGSNSVNFIGKCEIWCKYPEELVEGMKKPSKQDKSIAFSRCRDGAFGDSESPKGILVIELAGGGHSTRIPHFKDLGMMVLVISGFMFYM